MMNDIDSTNEWSTVSGKRASKCLTQLNRKGQTQSGEEEQTIDPLRIISLVTECKRTLSNSAYYQAVSTTLGARINDSEGYDAILALGIGTLSSATSQLQLAIYLCLLEDVLKVDGKLINTSRGVYDPILSQNDRKVYDLLHIPVLTENTKGKQTADGRVLFFLPHCPYRLYCNIVWANWGNLDRVHLYGNSFQSYSIRRTQGLSVKAKKGKSKKGALSAVVEEGVVDPSDTVALVTPFITEVDLWPSPGLFRSQGAVSSKEGTTLDTLQVDGQDETATATAAAPSSSSSSFVELDKNVFLKEARGVPALKHLENAVCDMSFMYMDSAVAASEQLARLWPSEELMDEASLRDVELL